ncbi:MAG: hypothetical protein HC896_02795 [Bacteroidales bacterium]|nr:hypothetical protein [Bacteroidales bacterium]
MRYAILFFVVLLAATAVCWPQNQTRIDIVNANTIEFDEQVGKDVRKLLGNVIFKHNDVLMYCDSAYHYSEANKVDAFSHIRINQGDTLFCTAIF